MTLTFGSLFAGIGGIDLGFERAGMTCRWQVEIDDYCQRVLAKHWPDVERYGDVRKCGKHNLAPVDLIAGGFPCQPHSVAGKQRGAEDDRDFWPEYRRIVAELRPRWVLAENVPGIKNTILDQVLSDLESLDYATGTLCVPACAFDAPHRRDRIFVIAYCNGIRCNARWPEEPLQKIGLDGQAFVADTNGQRWAGRPGISETPRATGQLSVEGNGTWWAVEPDVGRVAHGVPARVDRLRALGNAVVPQVAEWLGWQIVAVDAQFTEAAA